MKKIVAYFKAAWEELRYRTTWPSWEELQETTTVVVVATVILTIIIAAMDLVAMNLMDIIYSLGGQ